MGIFDRGTKKWTAMMLPEHVAQLRMVWNEDGREEQPMMDAVTLAEISDRIHMAILSNQEVKITYWNLDHIEKITGRVNRLKETNEYFQIVTSNGVSKIYFDEIIDADILEI